MARIRTVKPEMWDCEKLGKMSPLARLTFIGLLNLSDDEGLLRGTVEFVCSSLHKYARPGVKRGTAGALKELAGGRLVLFYQSKDEQSYCWVKGFLEHQRVDRPRKTTLPIPKGFQAFNRRIRRMLQERSKTEGKGMEGNGKEGNRKVKEGAAGGVGAKAADSRALRKKEKDERDRQRTNAKAAIETMTKGERHDLDARARAIVREEMDRGKVHMKREKMDKAVYSKMVSIVMEEQSNG